MGRLKAKLREKSEVNPGSKDQSKGDPEEEAKKKGTGESSPERGATMKWAA